MRIRCLVPHRLHQHSQWSTLEFINDARGTKMAILNGIPIPRHTQTNTQAHSSHSCGRSGESHWKQRVCVPEIELAVGKKHRESFRLARAETHVFPFISVIKTVLVLACTSSNWKSPRPLVCWSLVWFTLHPNLVVVLIVVHVREVPVVLNSRRAVLHHVVLVKMIVGFVLHHGRPRTRHGTAV